MFDKLGIFKSRADSSRDTNQSLFSDENSNVKLKRNKPYVYQAPNRQPMTEINQNTPLRSNTEPNQTDRLITPDPRLVQSVDDEIVQDSEEEITELISSSCLPSNQTFETSIPWNSQKLPPEESYSSQLSCISNDNFHAQDFSAVPIDSQLEFYTSQPQIGLSQAVSDDDVILIEDTIDEEEEEADEEEEEGYDVRFESNIKDGDEISEEFDKRDILEDLMSSEISSPSYEKIDFRIDEVLECSTQYGPSSDEEEEVDSKEGVNLKEIDMEKPVGDIKSSPKQEQPSDELNQKRTSSGSELVRKRLPSKPLSSICNSSQPRFRVGLSKRVKIDSLHTYLKKSK
ncbi:hypothetical protein JA1_001008 [Spathaspora sp. JA1]|nr:hypothetical protein JA1_001008 [Spathaspora sp. JA1]